MFGNDTICHIGAPISANNMYAITPNGVCKTRKYRNWIEKNTPLVQSQLRPAKHFPVAIEITIVQGRDWGPHCDPDNACKPIVDLLKRAGVIPDDCGKYVHYVSAKYMPLTSRGESLTQIQYQEGESEIEFFDVE